MNSASRSKSGSLLAKLVGHSKIMSVGTNQSKLMHLATAKAIQPSQFPFELLKPEVDDPMPIWDGTKFHIGDRVACVLEYPCKGEGWTEQLSLYHEHIDGSNHFIAQASRKHTLMQIQECHLNQNSVVLEIGSSTGEMLSLLKEHCPGFVIGSDIVSRSLERIAETDPGIPLMRFDLTQCPLPDNCVDVVVALNVFEHIERDDLAAAHLFRIMKPGAKAILEVPAGPDLYDDYDKLLKHYRRYSPDSFCHLLNGAGFQINYMSHLGFFLYPGFWLIKQLSKLKTKSADTIDEKSVARNIRLTSENPILRWIMSTELELGRYLHFPFGIRCLVTCSKPW
jgi:SAM-dependent methyltransferase